MLRKSWGIYRTYQELDATSCMVGRPRTSPNFQRVTTKNWKRTLVVHCMVRSMIGILKVLTYNYNLIGYVDVDVLKEYGCWDAMRFFLKLN
jgi:hypothetical protein